MEFLVKDLKNGHSVLKEAVTKIVPPVTNAAKLQPMIQIIL